MIIGIPKEIKCNENRVALTPGGVKSLKSHGHTVLIENNAGLCSSFSNEEYLQAGAEILEDKSLLFKRSELILKVKEPQPIEFDLFKPGQSLFTFLHLAANEPLTKSLLSKKVTAIAYESVQLDSGILPILLPMSEVAGRMSIQVGAHLLEKSAGGAGILLGGVPGVAPAHVFIIGGGTVGTNAAKIAVGMGARVTIMDVNSSRLTYLDDLFHGRVTTLSYNLFNLETTLQKADLVIGAVLDQNRKAPKLVTDEMVQMMKPGSVIVDVAIDQGGSFNTIDHITTHDEPTFEKYGVLHYAVANMPSAVPKTSTIALESATLPYVLQFADYGIIYSLLHDKRLFNGLNTFQGYLTCKGVAESLKISYTDALTVL